MTSFYFTITTVTTVGYGDFSASTFNEKIICIGMMVSGVIAFSMASAALTNYIDRQEQSSDRFEVKMAVLDRLQKTHYLPHQLYSRIKKNIEFNHIEDAKSLAEFVEDLPLDLKTPLSIHIFKDLYNNVDFLRGKTTQFITWICPLLKTRVSGPFECIYYEGDQLNEVYFLKSGQCNYTLPKFSNCPYIRIAD